MEGLEPLHEEVRANVPPLQGRQQRAPKRRALPAHLPTQPSAAHQPSAVRFQSGMLQSWNKFCFTGGIIEAELQFPGRHDTGGLWPAFWLLGNLGRATFEASTNLMWPWSYDTCNRCGGAWVAGIGPPGRAHGPLTLQANPHTYLDTNPHPDCHPHPCDRDLQVAQEISGCDVTSHYSLSPGVGRGATEIDIVEVVL